MFIAENEQFCPRRDRKATSVTGEIKVATIVAKMETGVSRGQMLTTGYPTSQKPSVSRRTGPDVAAISVVAAAFAVTTHGP